MVRNESYAYHDRVACSFPEACTCLGPVNAGAAERGQWGEWLHRPGHSCRRVLEERRVWGRAAASALWGTEVRGRVVQTGLAGDCQTTMFCFGLGGSLRAQLAATGYLCQRA